MATGGIFQLITNDGKQDRMLMASALLAQRLEAARAARAGMADPTPTLYDIEKTHILFTNAHFKPFAAIGFEYNKVNTSSGNSSLGQSVMFSIPQFGDFFNDMVVHAVIEQPSFGAGYADLPASKQNLMRWCDYPGERLLKKVAFNVNGNPLDEYDSDAVNFHREFSIQPNKELAWNRCVGQEEDEQGFLDQPTWEGNNVKSSDVKYRSVVTGRSGLQTPSGPKTEAVELFIPLLFWCNKDPRLAVPSVAIPYGQRFITLDLASSSELVGEVPRGYADGSDPWTASNLSAGGTLGLATLTSIELYINNIFVNPEVHNIFIKRIGFTLIRVHRRQSLDVNVASNSVLLSNLKWPIEALFVGMRVSEYKSSTDVVMTKKHLDKWHRFCQVKSEKRTTQGWKSLRVSAAEYATLPLAFASGVVPANPAALASFTLSAPAPGVPVVATLVGSTAFNVLKQGDVLQFVAGLVKHTLTVATVSASGLVVSFVESSDQVPGYVGGDMVAAPASAVVVTSSKHVESSYTVSTHVPTLKSLSIKAHGIPIYGVFPSAFFNSYLPFNYGGQNLRAPKDVGALLVTFCLYPGTYQPSGHINISRAREFYLDYVSAGYAGQLTTGTLVVIASAINFLLISDGSAVLRYST